MPLVRTRSRHPSAVALAAAGVALFAGCGHSSVDRSASAAQLDPTSSVGAVSAPSPTSGSNAGKPAGTSQSGSTKAPTPSQSIFVEGTNPSASPTTPAYPLSGNVTPACVRAGDRATVHVLTLPGAIVAYVAVYSGEKSGAAPPFGEGYGGNDHGIARGDGGWDNTWVLRADAPKGAGYVVVETASGDRREQIHVPFSVSRGLKGGC